MTQATHRRGLDDQLLGRAGEIAEAISEAFATRVVGQERLRTALLVSMATEGHVLLESVPGLAKTLASATLAQAVGHPPAEVEPARVRSGSPAASVVASTSIAPAAVPTTTWSPTTATPRPHRDGAPDGAAGSSRETSGRSDSGSRTRSTR